MQDTLPAAYQTVPVEVIHNMAAWAERLPASHQLGAYAAVNRLWRMRDPQIARLMADHVEKASKKGKGNG